VKKNPEFCSVGGARSKNSIFFAFLGYPSTVLHTAYTGNSFTTNQWYRLKVCLLLVWRVCDQAFGRYRPL